MFKALVIVSCAFPVVLASSANDREKAVEVMLAAGKAYWKQRVVIDHPHRSYYGFSGSQAVIEEGKTLYYASDSGMISEPHTFIEQEDSTGLAGVGMAYVVKKGYGELIKVIPNVSCIYNKARNTCPGDRKDVAAMRLRELVEGMEPLYPREGVVPRLTPSELHYECFRNGTMLQLGR